MKETFITTNSVYRYDGRVVRFSVGRGDCICTTLIYSDDIMLCNNSQPLLEVYDLPDKEIIKSGVSALEPTVIGRWVKDNFDSLVFEERTTLILLKGYGDVEKAFFSMNSDKNMSFQLLDSKWGILLSFECPYADYEKAIQENKGKYEEVFNIIKAILEGNMFQE